MQLILHARFLHERMICKTEVRKQAGDAVVCGPDVWPPAGKHWVGAGYRPGDLGATARPPLPSVAWSLLRSSREQGGRDLLGDVQAQVADGSGGACLSIFMNFLRVRKV